MKYTRLITGSPVLFLAFVFFGLSLFLFLALTTKLDVINTFTAVVRTGDYETMLYIQEAEASDIAETANITETVNITKGEAFIYLDKSKAVYPVLIQHVEKSNANLALHFNSDGQKMIQALSSHSLFIDIPQGKETLLHRIFVKGGKGHGG